MKGCPAFIDAVCLMSGLPKLWQRSGNIRPSPTLCRLPASVEHPPELEPHQLDWHWQSDRERLWIQVDCRSLAELCAGRPYLNAPELRSGFIRICRSLKRLLGLGRLPLRDAQDFIIWGPREYNTVADHAANATMDAQQSWTRCNMPALADALLLGQNLRLCLDGGRRSSEQAALGLALYSVTGISSGRATYTLIARWGHLLHRVDSALHLWQKQLR